MAEPKPFSVFQIVINTSDYEFMIIIAVIVKENSLHLWLMSFDHH